MPVSAASVRISAARSPSSGVGSGTSEVVVSGLDMSAEKTAKAMGSTPGAVRVAQHRALLRLRKALGE